MYNHYIAVDWAKSNMAIARMTDKSSKINVIDVPADVSELKLYLKKLVGKKILTIEETTTSQWLYTELKNSVDKLIICDPYRNRLLSEGAKTDKVDAKKLVKLLKADLLKEIFHSGDEYYHLRKFVSSYENLIGAGVRLKNQKSALLRASGLDKKEEGKLTNKDDLFVLERIDKGLELYEQEKALYLREIHKKVKASKKIKELIKIPGLGEINGVKLISRVVDAHRFKDRNQFWSYCGLVKLDRISGGRSYGKKNPRYSRLMKYIFKTAALAAISGDNPIRDYYDYLITEKKYPDHNARHAVARKIAAISYGVLKSGKKYEPYRRKEVIKNKADK